MNASLGYARVNTFLKMKKPSYDTPAVSVSLGMIWLTARKHRVLHNDKSFVPVCYSSRGKR